MMRKESTFTVLLLSLFALAACAAFEASPQEPVYVIVTSTPAASVQDTQATLVAPPTITPLPTSTPAPTPLPDVALRIAQRHITNGEYAEAVAAFNAVLAQPPQTMPVEIRAAATYGLGEAALREGLFAEATAALTSYLQTFPQGERTPHAFFLRGDAQLGLGQWQGAIADFGQYLALRPGVIDSYVYERIGDAFVGLGQVPQALEQYELAITAGRGQVPLLALHERVAQVYLNSARPLDALAHYDAILSVAENAGYRAQIAFLAAQALQAAGEPAAAFERYRQLIGSYPETAQAYQALQVLLAAGEAVDPALRGQVSLAAEDYEGAISAFHEYTGTLSIAEVPVEIHLMLGRAYRAVGNFTAGLTSFQTVVEQFPTSAAFGEALLEQGRTHFLAGDSPAAIQQYLYLADTYPDLPQAPEAMWRAGYLYETLGQQTEALAIFERLGREHPGTEQAMDGLLRAAIAAANRNDESTAERLFAALGATGSGEPVAAAYLWLGELAQRNGRAQQALSSFQAAAAADPGGYYSLRAEDLLNGGQPPFVPPAQYRFDFEDQVQLGQAEDWLRATFGVTQAEALWPMFPELQADPRVVAGGELWALLAFAEADEEFYNLLDAYAQDALASYQLAIWLRGIGAYPHSIVGAANIIKLANVETLDAPAYLARMRYPTFYRDLVVAAAQERGLDPLLMFALIRQESLFDRYATAAAGEKGLTQVIPSTGDYIAGRLNWPAYQHSVLFRPYASVAFGAYYLWEQLNLFDFNTIVGLAAYNAGPGNAANWLEASGGDPDLFVESITIPGTRLYVQRIYEHYHIYRQLYGG